MRREPINDDALFELVRGAVGARREALPDPVSGALADPRALRIFNVVLDSAVTLPAKAPAQRRAVMSMRTAALALTALVVAVALALGLTVFGTPSPALAKKFPVFAASQSELDSTTLKALQEANVDTTSARAIATPYGRGYVTTSGDGGELCVAVPPGNAEELHSALKDSPAGSNFSLIGGCAPTASAEDRGLFLNAPSRHATEIVVVLPVGASTPVLRGANGQMSTLTPELGTVAAVSHEAATLEYEVDGNRVSAAVELANSSVSVITPER